jgi:hypothetical protein
MGGPMTHGRSLQKLGREIAEELDAMRDESVLTEARERLFERKRAVAPAPRSRAPYVAAGFAFAAAAAAAVFMLRARAPEPMAFDVGDPPQRGAQGAWVAASADAPVPLRFADGSRFEVQRGGRARVSSSTREDARLVLESGTLRGDVMGPDKGGVWHVTAGPFDVAVTGTKFVMSWDPVIGVLDVRDISSRVVVTGPYAAEGVAVKRGDYLRVSLEQARLEVSASPPPAPPPAAPSSAPPLSPDLEQPF